MCRKVKRYNMAWVGDDAFVQEAEDGEYVKHTAYEKQEKKAEAGEKLCIALQQCSVKLPPGVRTYITNYYERIKNLG